mmetsp:Transcript_65861/g.157131  ORF Transcript_65861/g.157131 Transcript_65861/m.157131 type:complete len:352 (-) Transcript_65861:953-2008(-)
MRSTSRSSVCSSTSALSASPATLLLSACALPLFARGFLPSARSTAALRSAGIKGAFFSSVRRSLIACSRFVANISARSSSFSLCHPAFCFSSCTVRRPSACFRFASTPSCRIAPCCSTFSSHGCIALRGAVFAAFGVATEGLISFSTASAASSREAILLHESPATFSSMCASWSLTARARFACVDCFCSTPTCKSFSCHEVAGAGLPFPPARAPRWCCSESTRIASACTAGSGPLPLAALPVGTTNACLALCFGAAPARPKSPWCDTCFGVSQMLTPPLPVLPAPTPASSWRRAPPAAPSHASESGRRARRNLCAKSPRAGRCSISPSAPTSPCTRLSTRPSDAATGSPPA